MKSEVLLQLRDKIEKVFSNLPLKEPQMKKKELPAERTPSEREEMIRLKAENEHLRAENEAIKKKSP